MEIQKDVGLRKYNTFQVEANAKYFLQAKNLEDVHEAIKFSTSEKLKVLVLGAGSNILFTKDFEGLVIKMELAGIETISENEKEIILSVGAGVSWESFVDYCAASNYWGVENLALIPGSCGAAPVQNIGAYGQEIKNVFHEAIGISIDTNSELKISKEESKLEYRNSVFKSELKDKFVITSISFRLSKIPNPIISYKAVTKEIKKRSLESPTAVDMSNIIKAIRRSKLPDPTVIGNAGSFFKNPVVSNQHFDKIRKKYPQIIFYPEDKEFIKISAGWLVENSNWKGKRVGDAGVYEDHALVLVNYGNASGRQIHNLAKQIKLSVRDKFGIKLDEEVNIL